MRSQLVSIRPEIQTIINNEGTGDMELFQNQTLRPILKFQNNLILFLFRNHLVKQKIDFQQMTKIKRNEWIEQVIQNDRKIHQLLVGTIIGHFTDVELETYILKEKEFNRRIVNLLIQRLQDQL